MYQIGIASLIVLDEMVAEFGVQSDIRDHLKDVDDIFQHKERSQSGSEYGAGVCLLHNEVHQGRCSIVLQE